MPTRKRAVGKVARRVTYPLKSGDKGAAITALQSALESLGLQIQIPDTEKGKFGDETAKALSKFRQAYGLQTVGEFTQRDAEFLNGLIQDLELDKGLTQQDGKVTEISEKIGDKADTKDSLHGKLNAEGKQLDEVTKNLASGTELTKGLQGTLSVHTSVLNKIEAAVDANLGGLKAIFVPTAPLAKDAKGARVEHLHEQLQALDYKVADPEWIDKKFGDSTENALRLFQESERLPHTGVLEESTARALDRLLRAREVTVSGRVTDSLGAGVANLKVQVKQVQVKADTLLGKAASTDLDGRYSITFYSPAGPRPIWALRVEARLGQAGEPLAQSNVVRQPGARVEINLVVPSNQTLYQRYIDAVSNFLDGAELEELEETAAKPQRSLLASASCIQFADIDALCVAARHEASAKDAGQGANLTEEIFFALLSRGLPRDLKALLAIDRQRQKEEINACAKSNVVSPTLAEDSKLEAILNDIKRYLTYLVKLPSQVSGSDITQIMVAANLSSSQKTAVAQCYAQQSNDSAGFWKVLSQDTAFQGSEGDKALGRVKAFFDLTPATGYHLPLAEKLVAQGLTTIEKLVQYSSPSWWHDMVAKGTNPTGVPDGVPGEDAESRAINYARAMAAMVEDDQPAPAFVLHLSNDTGLASVIKTADAENLKKFFVANKEFDVFSTWLEQYEVEHQNVFAGYTEEQKKETVRIVKRAQRLAKLTPLHSQVGIPLEHRKSTTGQQAKPDDGFVTRYQAVKALLAGGLASAKGISRLARNTFVNDYAKALGGRRRAELIHRAAQRRAARAVAAYVRHHPVLHRNEPFAIRGEPNHAQPSFMKAIRADRADGNGEAEATWRLLFGHIDYCACPHCRSVLSPAAYLADVLQYLGERKVLDKLADDGTPVWKKLTANGTVRDLTAKDVFFERLPAVGDIELTCENANTPLPYVDLVNETLEDVVLKDAVLEGFEFDAALLDEAGEFLLTQDIQKVFNEKHHPLVGEVTVEGKNRWKLNDNLFSFRIEKVFQRLFVSAPTRRARQTRRTAAELAANPEYVNPRAYEPLKEAVYPWSLPFNLALDEIRTYLAPVKLKRYELMEGFSSKPMPDCFGEKEIAQEFLGLSAQEAQIICGKNPAQPWALWGLSENDNKIRDPLDETLSWEGPWLTVLARASVLMDRASISFRELLELAACHFISADEAGGKLVIGAGCEPSAITVGNLIPEHAQRMHRFLRLWRRLGWTMRDLDRAITAFRPTGTDGKPALTDTFLVQLSYLERLRAEFGLSVEELLAWWGPLDTARHVDYTGDVPVEVPSFYEQLFQSRVAASRGNPDLALRPNRQEVVCYLGPGNNETDPKKYREIETCVEDIASALGVSIEALKLLVPWVTIGQGKNAKAPVNLENLSRLFRYTSLAKALGLSIRDMFSLRSITGTDPFSDDRSRPLEAALARLKFVARAQAVRAVGFTVAELAYLLRDESTPGTGVALELAEGRALVRELGEGIRRIKLEYATQQASIADVYGEPQVRDLLERIMPGEQALAVLEMIKGAKSEAEAEDYRTKQAKEKLIDDYLSVYLDASGAKTRLIPYEGETDPGKEGFDAAKLAARFAYIVEPLKACLSFVTERVAAAFGIEAGVMDLLIGKVLRSDDSDAPALADFLLLGRGGLHGVYYQDKAGESVHWENRKATRIDDCIKFDWRQEQPDPSVAAGPFSVRWTGRLVAPADGTYTFFTETDDGARLSVDGQVLVDQLIEQSKKEYAGQIELRAGAWYEIELDYFNVKPDAVAHLRWSGPSVNGKEIVPSECLAPLAAATLKRLHKSVLLITKLRLTAAEIEHLGTGSKLFKDLDLNSLADRKTTSDSSFEGWERLTSYVRARDALMPSSPGILELLEIAVPGTDVAPGTQKSRFLATLERLLRWSMPDLETLLGKRDSAGDQDQGLLKQKFPDDFLGARLLERLERCIKLLHALGASAAQMDTWTSGSPDYLAAESLKAAVKGRFGKEDWLALAKPLRDTLRERQRQALVTYLIAFARRSDGRPQFRDAVELGDHYLIDVEMSPCQLTSRIKYASGAVQVFVQRCLMNLEKEIFARADLDSKWADWSWMKNYRVWEANRNVFLYPENWIEPELREDKSPFFKELEDELAQNDITAATAEAAFLHYLGKLNDVARLEFCAVYREREVTGAGIPVPEVWHVVARTYAQPHRYYYRQRIVRGSSTRWTSWERIDVDIQAEYLVVCVWNRRPYLFWPILSREEKEENLKMPEAESYIEPPQRRWKIEMAWTERTGERWHAKRLGNGAVFTEYFDRASTPDTDDQFLIDVEIETETNDLILNVGGAGTFRMDGCSGRLEVESDENSKRETRALGRTTLRYMRFEEQEALQVADKESLALTLKTIHEALLDLADAVRDALADREGERLAQVVLQLADDLKQTLLSWQSHDPGFSWGTANKALLQALWRWALECRNTLGSMKRAVEAKQGPSVTKSLELAAAIRLRLKDIPHDQLILATAQKADPDRMDSIRTLNSTPGLFKVWQERFQWFDNDAPLFYADASRTYMVTTEALKWQPYEIVPPSPAHQPAKEPFDYLDVKKDFALKNDAPVADFGGSRRQSYPVRTSSTAGAPKPRPAKAGYWRPTYRFHNFYHPFVYAFQRELRRGGVNALLDRTLQLEPHRFTDPPQTAPFSFKDAYGPEPVVNPSTYPREIVDFEAGEAYSLYNWELFFHAPLLIADRLSKNQQFDAAHQWFHFIFDPTDASDKELPSRYWQMAYFFKNANEAREQSAQAIVNGIAQGGEEFLAQVAEWEANPFQPHVVARTRPSAYQRLVVMKYLDNLIAWGDQIFRRATDFEHIQEATQIYLLAQGILGRRAQSIPARVLPSTKSVAALLSETSTGDLADPLVETENLSAGDAEAIDDGPDTEATQALPPLYFCVPENKKLLDYWDTVADRLFKIRHCMTIEGVKRQLPLFEPPIEPGLLVKARAAGVDISTALSDISAALPRYRFTFMLQKALELCNELKALGGALLSALEKRDAEGLALLRSTHEIKLLEAVRNVRLRQVEEAKESLEGLKRCRKVVETRRDYYTKLAFMNPREKLQLDQLGQSMNLSMIKTGIEMLANVIFGLPDVKVGTPTTVGATLGGSNAGNAIRAYGSYYGEMASLMSQSASMTGLLGGHDRRFAEWKFQETVANRELEQIDRQIAGAEIRFAIAERELENHELQIENSRAADEYMRYKYTNQDLYSWLSGQVSGLFFRSYQLAYDIAKRTERCYRHELGVGESNFVQFGYWDSLKKGLLSGERLGLDLKRMEMAYLERNEREIEITKHISLQSLDPVALVRLREEGKCEVKLPEVLFDLDYPGHYMRRIKSIAVTIPCVTGPYIGVPCTLTLLASKTRRNSKLHKTKYQYDADGQDPRFEERWGVATAIVTSNAQNDAGLFEANLRDERYLPFEGEGVISDWRLELPISDWRLGIENVPKPTLFTPFDYYTISDVVMHIRYTARFGGEPFRSAVQQELTAALNNLKRANDESGLVRAVSLRHEFPAEWQRFSANADGQRVCAQRFSLSKDRFSFLFQRSKITITRVDLIGVPNLGQKVQMLPELSPPGTQEPVTFIDGEPIGDLLHRFAKDLSIEVADELDKAEEPDKNDWKLKVLQNQAPGFFKSVRDLVVICSYSVSSRT